MGSDGSYFQCPYCQKRYAASAKARAADGKRIRCKECQQPFTLTIVSASKPRVQLSRTVASTEPRRPPKPAPPPATKRVALPRKKGGRKSLFQLGTVLILLSVLAAVGGWWLLHDNAVVVETARKAPAADSDTTAVVADDALPNAEEVRKMTQEVQPPDLSTLNFVVSPACRDAAAAQWMNDYTMTHTRFRQAEFVRLLDESVSLTARIHQECQNNTLLLSVIESAKEGKKPVWLAPLINTLINPEYDSTKMVGDGGF